MSGQSRLHFSHQMLRFADVFFGARQLQFGLVMLDLMFFYAGCLVQKFFSLGRVYAQKSVNHSLADHCV